jgi:two-component system, OmpR family, alkaline phosphatase synthesis response regulator PhoP
MAKILIADDEPDVLLIVSERLRRSGHKVEYAPDGIQAMQKAGENVYDLLILDIRMPGHTGFEVCEYTKGSEKNGKAAVLLISAFPEEKKTWHQSKADAFLMKPFEVGQLMTTISQLLEGNG